MIATICLYIWIGIGIGISIGKIFSSVLGIESIGKKWYRSTFNLKPSNSRLVSDLYNHSTLAYVKGVYMLEVDEFLCVIRKVGKDHLLYQKEINNNTPMKEIFITIYLTHINFNNNLCTSYIVLFNCATTSTCRLFY